MEILGIAVGLVISFIIVRIIMELANFVGSEIFRF